MRKVDGVSPALSLPPLHFRRLTGDWRRQYCKQQQAHEKNSPRIVMSSLSLRTIVAALASHFNILLAVKAWPALFRNYRAKQPIESADSAPLIGALLSCS